MAPQSEPWGPRASWPEAVRKLSEYGADFRGFTWWVGVVLVGEKLGPESRMHGRMEEP